MAQIKVMCIKSVVMQNGKDKGKEAFTKGNMYSVIENGFLAKFYSIGDVTLESNFKREHAFTKKSFDTYFSKSNDKIIVL